MTATLTVPFVTPHVWSRTRLQYGTLDTYRLAADWLRDCATVADWGGASGFFGTFLPTSTNYRVVDGTQQACGQALADLATYHEPSEGILLRHVLDNTEAWQVILRNAVAAFTKRLVVVTFTPSAERTTKIVHKSGWPIWHFAPADLLAEMGDLLIKQEYLLTSHPEHVYFLERRS